MAESETLIRDDDELVPAPFDLEPAEPFSVAVKPHRRLSRRLRTILAVAGLIVGAGLVVAATVVMTDVSAIARIGVALVAVVVLFFSLDTGGKLVFGDQFETGVWLALFWLGLVVLSAVFADLLPLSEARNASLTLTDPNLVRPDLFSAHPFGTDRQGLDILGGVIYGARVSLIVGVGAVVVGTLLGGLIGTLAGYYRRKLEGFVNLFTDALLAFPPLILLLGMVTVLEPNVQNVTIALAILVIPTYIRLSRANTLVLAQREFVLAARGLGETKRRIILRELVPNIALPVVSYGFIIVAVLIVAEASLSFLGLSIQRPNPTWGNMIAAGQSDFDRHPHLVFVPGTVLFLTVFSLNRAGDKARKLWDPRNSTI